MSKYPCDNWSWSSRRCDPRLRDGDANKENREPISPLSRLAERVDDSRRWAPIPDRWHNHCEWLVNHHRNLRKRFRRTTANDRLAGVLTTLKCTRERRQGSDEDQSVVGHGSRCKRIRSDVEYPELEPASIWLGSVHPEMFQLEKVVSPPKDQPLSEEGDEMEVETQKTEPDLKAADVACNPTIPNSLTENDESTPEKVKTLTAAATQSTFRSPSPVEGAFEPDNFRTSTPTADERSRRDPEEPCASFRRSSAWKDYVMSHDPILFRSYVNTQYPKKSWRHSHQKVAARHCGKYRRNSSGRIRKPPTPKSLRISWNSLNDVVRNEGILRSPLRLPPILPGDVTPPTNSDNDHGVDVQLDDNLSANDIPADVDNSDVIGDGIRAIRMDCRARYQSANESYAASDERDVESSVYPSDLSDISFGEEGGESTDKHDYDLEDISSDDDIEDICRIVDKELHHDDCHPDDILSEISFDILDDLEVDSKYPPNYFRAGFADRAVRRRKIKKVMRMINKLDPQARSFKPRYKHEKYNGDQRIVKFADRETSDGSRDKEKMEDACGSGTKFYPSDVRFSKKDGVKKVGETPKASAHKYAESKVVIPVPAPVPVKRVDPKRVQGKNVNECGSLKNRESEVKEGNVNEQEQCLKEEVCKTVESERSVPNSDAGLMADAEKNEKTPSIKTIAKGKVKRQVAHKISVVMGRRPWKPSQAMENRTGDDGGRSVTRSLASGDDDNGGVMSKRIPQLRQIEMIHQDNANAVGKDLIRPSSGENVIKTDGTVSDKFTAENVTIGATGHRNAAKMEESVQSRALQSDPSIRSLDVTQPRYSGLMKQRLALLKESYGNGPVGAARLANLTDHLQEQLDSKKISAVAKCGTSKECEQPRMAERQEFGHRDVELPDVNNNRIANNVPQAKIHPLSTFADAGNNDEIDKGKGTSDLSSGSQQNELSCTKTCPAKAKQPESLVNVERAMPLQSEKKEVGRGSGNPLAETGRENHPPQPLIQNPPHRFPHPHHNMNPNVHPNMHLDMRVMPGNAPLYQHPSDQQHPFNPTFSAYHHHQMALRTAAMHYYNQQRHMVLQRHPPGFYHPHPHHMNMHPGYRPEWNKPGPGPPR